MDKKIEKKIKKNKKPKRGRRVGLMLSIILTGIIFSYSFSKFDFMRYVDKLKGMLKEQKEVPEEKVEKELPLVKVFHVIRSDFRDNLPIIGTVKGYKELDLRFETAGVIEKINYATGDLVTKENIVANLFQKEAKYKIEYQKANYEVAQSSFLSASKKLANSQKMFNAGAIVSSKLDEAILEAENAALKMKAAHFEYLSSENELTKTEIVAAVDGVVAIRHMEEGEYVTSSEKVVTVMEISRVYVEVGVVEKDVDKVAIGLTAHVVVDTYPGVAFEGTVMSMSPLIEGKSRTMTAKIEINNDQLLLLPGMYARTDISVYETQDTIMLPATALNKGQEGGYTVNVVTIDDKVEIRKIEPVYFSIDREYVEIAGGVDSDEFVIIEFQQEIKEGDSVQVIEVRESIFTKKEEEGQEEEGAEEA